MVPPAQDRLGVFIMLATIITSSNRSHYVDLLNKLYALRYLVFVERLGWTIPGSGSGRDVDEFDNDSATYIIVHRGGSRDQILASLRLNPTSGPTLLTTTFRRLVDSPFRTGSDVWDGTRLLANPALSVYESRIAVATLLGTTFSYGSVAGASAIVSVSDPLLERILRRLGLAPRRLGPVETVELGVRALPLWMDCNQHVANRVWSHAQDATLVTRTAALAA